MKIDVEGAEVALVRGARQTLERSLPRVFMSLHIPESDVKALVSELTSMGYDVTFEERSYDLVAIARTPA
jgi:hypothetical protein